MIIDENLTGYIRSFEPDLPDYLYKMEKEGLENLVPIIKKESQSVLRFLLKAYRPKKLLEIGTAIGFSASLMLDILEGDAEIITIEKSSDRVADAQRNFSTSPYMDSVKLVEGDASEVLNQLVNDKREFDFVFMDAAKAQYSEYLKHINKLLKPGGVLLTDNILQEGSVYCSKFSVIRRDRTIHQRMRQFLDHMMKTEEYSSCIIPIGDGMLMSIKK